MYAQPQKDGNVLRHRRKQSMYSVILQSFIHMPKCDYISSVLITFGLLWTTQAEKKVFMQNSACRTIREPTFVSMFLVISKGLASTSSIVRTVRGDLPSFSIINPTIFLKLITVSPPRNSLSKRVQTVSLLILRLAIVARSKRSIIPVNGEATYVYRWPNVDRMRLLAIVIE